ncbi:phosphoglucosamine mutase [Limnoglobus roseus]|uniref:Phosphoglucosamine mutase n=1 Tax=Limnoglobus roseus TaxID=2598579 RepID=A0A5C1AJA1_9BACT|nr:phosphoglucosamine mutase [Limnoglobus roseus]QEL18263.1 phosphoglucosamine mutase [Limnoglobus roseus]
MNTSELIVSVSGIRGIVGESLPPDAAVRFAAALGTYLKGGKVLVSRDSRPSGDMLRHAIFAGLMATGCAVEDIGIQPTPTVGIAVRTLNAAGAIQITASHNPSPWNGLKLFGRDGAVLPAAAGLEIKKLFEAGPISFAPWDRVGSAGVPPNVEEDHAERVLKQVSVATVAAGQFRVFVDGNGGAGGPLAVDLLASLGCEVVQLNCEQNGVFAHEAEPIPAHLTDIAPWVSQHGCHVGCVLDPDADRLALIDETGACVSEEATVALAIKYRLRQDRGAVVVNMSTSRMNEDLAKLAGCEFYRSAVGEANVVEKMRAVKAVIGGEGNGGVIDPRVGWVRDPYVGMALILSLMAEEGKPLSQLVAELPTYSMLKTKFTVARERLGEAFGKLEKKWPTAAKDTLDGLRLDGPDWWLHVRASNTEPIVRVIAEAPTADAARQLCDEAGAIVSG